MKTADIIAMLGLQNELEAEHCFVISIRSDPVDIKRELGKVITKDSRFIFRHFLDAINNPAIRQSLVLYVLGNKQTGVVSCVMYNTATKQVIKG